MAAKKIEAPLAAAEFFAHLNSIRLINVLPTVSSVVTAATTRYPR